VTILYCTSKPSIFLFKPQNAETITALMLQWINHTKYQKLIAQSTLITSD